MTQLLDSFLTVGQQVLGLFVLVCVGVICGKKGILTQSAVRGCAELVLLFATPCVILQSFERENRPEMLLGLLFSGLAALAVHALGIAAAHLSFRGEEARERVLRFGVVFSNAGYMAIPLQKALLGEDGVFYGAAYVAVFNLVLWSYGVMAMSGDRKALSARRLLLNPGVIGLAAGLLLFFTGIRLPAFLEAPVGHLAALNTPLPMLIVGFYLADADLKSAVRNKRLIASMGLRLLAVPLLTLGLLYLCGMRGALLTACVIAASAPAAAATTMFATRYGQDARLSVNLVALSTLCSMLTMPLVVGAAKALGG